MHLLFWLFFKLPILFRSFEQLIFFRSFEQLFRPSDNAFHLELYFLFPSFFHLHDIDFLAVLNWVPFSRPGFVIWSGRDKIVIGNWISKNIVYDSLWVFMCQMLNIKAISTSQCRNRLLDSKQTPLIPLLPIYFFLLPSSSKFLNK